MKKYKDSFKLKIKRLILAILGQAIWLVPLGVAGWYAYTRLPEWSETYFDVAQARQVVHRLSERTAVLSEPVLWNPSTIAAYLKALFMSTAATTKMYTLVSVAGMISGIGRLILYIFGILAALYALIRVKRAYRAKTQVQEMTVSVCQAMLPELEQMQAQIQELTKQVALLKQMLSDQQKSEG